MESSQIKPRWIRDLWGILFLAVAVLVLFSLLSYSSGDEWLDVHSDHPQFRNWIGPGGAMVAGLLFGYFGFFGVLIPLVFFALAGRCFWPEAFQFSQRHGVAALIGILSACGLLYGFVSKPLVGVLPGGVIGALLHLGLAKYLSTLGAQVLLAAFLTMSFVLVPGLRFWDGLQWFRKKEKEPETETGRPVLGIKIKNVVEDVEIGQPAIVEMVRYAKNPPAPKGGEITPKAYQLPPLKLLDYDAPVTVPVDEQALRVQAERLKKTFLEFGIDGHVREIRPGPIVTMFEFVPAPGVKLSRIASLADDIAMAMEAIHVRVVAPIPGKGAVGIEVPNDNRETVFLKEIVQHKNFQGASHPLTMAVGKNIEGRPYTINLADMPHLLIAGTTGSGKSVSVNAMICSLLYRATPREVRFIMIDPKMLELSIYDGIPHLLLPPIIDSKKAAVALRWAIKEMDRRYLQMNEIGVRDIDGYNAKTEADKKMPYVVIVVDEYADLMMVAGKEVESHVMRLAQKARACGIHVILATQRPSVDVVTGVIKANFPVRMGFRLASAHDSKTIINRSGAEKLLGRGDMLIMPPGTSDLVRVHGAYISEKELVRVIDFWKTQATPEYDLSILQTPEEESPSGFSASDEGDDEKYREAIAIVLRTQKCSTSWLQRHLGVGYNRAARIVEQMERSGVVGPIMNARGDREIFGARPEQPVDTQF